MSMTIRHSFETVYEAGLHGQNYDYLVVYETNGDLRKTANMRRLIEALHSEFGSGCAYEEIVDHRPNEEGDVVTHLAVQDDVLVLMMVCQLLRRVRDSGWIELEDWDENIDRIRELFWDDLPPEERAHFVLTYEGNPSEILGDLPPTHPLVVEALDRAALDYT